MTEGLAGVGLLLEEKRSAGPLRLMLGGRDQKLEGWTNVDLHDGPNVDIKTDISNLSAIQAGSVSSIYASHCLEHFPHPRTVSVLKEWARVLKVGGEAFISVPDFDAMVKLYNKVGVLAPFIRNMLCGDQGYDLAYHYNLFTYATLASSCIEAGFSDIKRIDSMPYKLDDCSTLVDTITYEPISVSIRAIR